MARKRCVICDKPITEQFYVCIGCVNTHNIPYKYRNWPRWLKDLVNIEIRNLSILREEEKHISFDFDDYDIYRDEVYNNNRIYKLGFYKETDIDKNF